MFNDVVVRKDARDLRSELVAAAVALLAEPQVVAVPSLRSIARACGVAPSAVYWHFPSEADLRSAVLDAEYTSMADSIEAALEAACEDADRLVVAGDAYIAWGLAHPGAYQLLFESADELPETRAAHGPRLQTHIVELARKADPGSPFAAALLLWSAWHGIVSLRLHKNEWDWGMTTMQANRRLVAALTGRTA
ncbi:TetR/AcrR family transcriptional regulator [Streptomyces sp. ISL-1]|uniref:TetR/AcrR family transcriptional regulator n=1 Tax=Streptomyces sp. ISL-1 TaxID=2817657 RepID=UPI001BEC8481|nr:TetR/AcrR family transcriptional regulator [Streptomyces sp. ISL-1]MBT2388319.1 TetR/AcrR family transcriptional regulator [Streptomyces sp. ISL-1]